MTTQEKLQVVCKALSAKKAEDIKVVDIQGMTYIADFFVVCSGRRAPQVKAIYDNLDEEMSKAGFEPKRSEGISEGRWIAVDYSDIIVHVFHKEAREVYALDTLWNKGDNVTTYND